MILESFWAVHEIFLHFKHFIIVSLTAGGALWKEILKLCSDQNKMLIAGFSW